jgi:hypothetical protein
VTFHDVNLAGLAAIPAIVQAVAAQPDTELSHADAAVTVAFAPVFRLVAHSADSCFHFAPEYMRHGQRQQDGFAMGLPHRHAVGFPCGYIERGGG